MSSITFESPIALQILNGFFENNQFVKGEQATDADEAVVKALGAAPPAEYAHAAKWYATVAKPDAPAAAAAEDEDDIDLFGSDDEEVDEEAERVKAQRLAEYAAKKANKPKTIAKTTVTLDVKPWDDETDMEALTAAVKSIQLDGLVWGGSQLVAIGYGIKKLQINCVVEDDKVLLDDLAEKITDFEDYVQSVDVAAMQKI